MGDTLGEQVSERTNETFSGTDMERLTWAVNQIINNKFGKPKKYVYFSDEEDEEIYKAFMEGTPDLDEFRMFFTDVISWAWEKAYIPTGTDIRYAGDEAISTISLRFKNDVFDYPLIEEYLSYSERTPAIFMKGLMDGYINYFEKEGGGDPYFIFKPDVDFINRILDRKALYESRSVLSWIPMPEYSRDEMRAELKNMLEGLEEPFLIEMFRVLKKEQKESSKENRYNFHSTFSRAMENDKERVKVVKKEIMDFLESRKESEKDA